MDVTGGAMQAARGQASGVGAAGLNEEQRLRIAANRQKALYKRASKSAGPGLGPSLALAAPPHVREALDGAATAALVPDEQLMDGVARVGMSSAEPASRVAAQHWEAQYFRSTCGHVIRSVRPRVVRPCTQALVLIYIACAHCAETCRKSWWQNGRKVAAEN